MLDTRVSNLILSSIGKRFLRVRYCYARQHFYDLCGRASPFPSGEDETLLAAARGLPLDVLQPALRGEVDEDAVYMYVKTYYTQLDTRQTV